MWSLTSKPRSPSCSAIKVYNATAGLPVTLMLPDETSTAGGEMSSAAFELMLSVSFRDSVSESFSSCTNAAGKRPHRESANKEKHITIRLRNSQLNEQDSRI